MPASSERTGMFITFEGGEGAGKSTQIPALAAHLGACGIRTLQTREPGGTRLGEALRGVLLDPDFAGMDARAELLMMFAARAEHLSSVISPALDCGTWVVCDRFTDATFAYQGAGRGLGEAAVALLEDLVQGALRPDLVIVLDVPVHVGMERARGRGRADRFEGEEIAFFEQVRAAYLSRATSMPERYAVIDASLDAETVTAAVIGAVDERLR